MGAMLRAGRRPSAFTVAPVAPGQWVALDDVAESTVTLKAGERAGAAQREAEGERQAQRRGLGCEPRSPASAHMAAWWSVLKRPGPGGPR
jgi:hypothetical protein